MNDLNRRKFLLKYGALGTSFLILPNLIRDITSSVVSRELRGETYNDNYIRSIHFFAHGGANFTTSFLPLTPYGTKGFDDNKIYTRFTEENNRLEKLSYETVNVHDIELPYIWGQQVQGSTGPLEPEVLAKNMLVIRGINSGNAGHAGAIQLKWVPGGSNISLSGLTPTRGHSVFPSIALDNRYPYKSTVGKNRVSANFKDHIGSLFKPFEMDVTGEFRTKIIDQREKISHLLDNMIKDAKNQGYQVEQLGDNKKKVADLVYQGFEKYTENFDATKNKYATLMNSTRDLICEGVNNLKVGQPLSQREFDILYQFRRSEVHHSDKDDIKDHFTGIPYGLDVMCAYAEIGAVHSLFDSIYAPVKNWIYTFDEHVYGSFLSVYRGAQLGRMIISCLSELQRVFKNKGIWDKVVMELSSEFTRSIRGDGGGSDHGWSGATSSIFSGMIQKPFVLGNIWGQTEKGRERVKGQGTWGSGAPTRVSTSQEYQITNNLYFTTFADIVKVPVVSSGTSLIKHTNEGIVKNDGVELAKIVS